MRALLVLTAILFIGVAPARADAVLEARVLRLEAQVKALQESLKAAVQMDRVYSLKAAGSSPDSCLSSAMTDPAAKTEVFLAKCRTPDGGDNGHRNWKIEPAQQ